MRLTARYAPGSVGDIGTGLDVLGLAVAGAGDWVTAELLDVRGIELRDPGHPDLPATRRGTARRLPPRPCSCSAPGRRHRPVAL